MNNILDEAIEISKRFEKESKTFHTVPINHSPEYKKLINETNKKIRDDQILQAKVEIKAKHFVAL